MGNFRALLERAASNCQVRIEAHSRANFTFSHFSPFFSLAPSFFLYASFEPLTLDVCYLASYIPSLRKTEYTRGMLKSFWFAILAWSFSCERFRYVLAFSWSFSIFLHGRPLWKSRSARWFPDFRLEKLTLHCVRVFWLACSCFAICTASFDALHRNMVYLQYLIAHLVGLRLFFRHLWFSYVWFAF